MRRVSISLKDTILPRLTPRHLAAAVDQSSGRRRFAGQYG